LGKIIHQHASRRCGSEKLEKELAIMLRGMINLQIPAMKTKLLELIGQTEEESSKAGKSIEKGAAQETLIKLSQKLERLVSSHVHADGVVKDFWHQIDDELHGIAYKIQQTAPLFAINGKLISREVTIDSSDTTNTPMLSLSLDKDQLSGSTCVQSKEIAIGGAKWALNFLPKEGTANAQIKIQCTKLPKGARSVKTTYTLTPENAGSHTKEYSFSLDGSSDGLDFSFPAATEHVVIEATIQIQVSCQPEHRPQLQQTQ
jgi:hypothetical protein